MERFLHFSISASMISIGIIVVLMGLTSDIARRTNNQINHSPPDAAVRNDIGDLSIETRTDNAGSRQHNMSSPLEDGEHPGVRAESQITRQSESDLNTRSPSTIAKRLNGSRHRECKSVQKDLDLSGFNGRITIDDGPHPDTTPCLVRMLTEANVSDAIFFFLGYRMLEYPSLVPLVVNAGYEVGYHSMFHQNFMELSHHQILEDIRNFRKVLEEVLGKHYQLKIGRPPFGGMTSATVKIFRGLEDNGTLSAMPLDHRLISRVVDPKIIAAFESEQLHILLWNVDFDDWNTTINTEIATDYYEPHVPQVWLLHENPIDWVTLRGFDNDLVASFPALLETFGKLQQSALTLQNLTGIVQELLVRLGYDPGPIDGLQGANTQAAVRAFQREHGLLDDGHIDKELFSTLRSAAGEKE